MQGQLPSNHRLTPATIISSLDSDNGANAISRKIESFIALDDVYSIAFASYIIIQTAPGAASWKPVELKDGTLIDVPVSSQIVSASVFFREGDLPSGPYFVRDGLIHEAWRLYCDDLDAFEVTIVPHVDTSASKLESLIYSAVIRSHSTLTSSSQILDTYSVSCQRHLEECRRPEPTLCQPFKPQAVSWSTSECERQFQACWRQHHNDK